jgi:5-formyltetrahydrofolate cyclo-ligase
MLMDADDFVIDRWSDIKSWRNLKRKELLASRLQASNGQRRLWNERITGLLLQGFSPISELTVGFCWPYKREFDARHVIRNWRIAGVKVALPEVVSKNQPLQYRAWWPGAQMTTGVYGIPFPLGTEVVMPDIVLVPMNGFDEQGYRLGYGGGYFDRTLAAAAPRPLAIGISFELSRLPTIYPQPHDIPMDFVVTETAIHRRTDEKLTRIAPAKTRDIAQCLLEIRHSSQSDAVERVNAGSALLANEWQLAH